MNLRRAQPNEVSGIMEWIRQGHYLGDTPPGCVVALELLDRKDRIGAFLLGRPCARGFNSSGYRVETILELTRAYFIDKTPHCIESQALGMMRKFIRTWFQSIRLLLAYSDPTEGHNGTIYAADGWVPFGLTTHKNGKGWKSRDARKDTHSWQKQRWVRTP